uniref:Cns1/TTC4 wheel domain-containing protein n=1 Tax=Aplanochytrium stocchinoi TaxID=215587 RepID=A0A7S3LIY7_9STRA
MVEFEELPDTETDPDGFKATTRTSTDLKEKGNQLFKEKRYKEALAAYQNALSVSLPIDTAIKCALYGNLASTFFKLGDFEDALKSCRKAQELNPDLMKLHARAATILGSMHKYDEAIEVLQSAIKRCPDEDKKTSLQRSLSNMKISQEKIRKREHAAQGKPKEKEGKRKVGGFLNRASGQSIYEDKPCAAKTETEAQQLAAKRLLDKLKESLGTNDEDLKHMTLVDGLFTRLMDPKEFQRIVYHGAKIPADQNFLPRTFEELLNNELYANTLVGLFPKIRQRAHVVLENVKRKGALEGDIMDARTETMLKPQVLNEAFAHEVVAMIKQVNRKQNAFLAQSKEFVAEPDSEQALGDHLEVSVVEDLLDDEKGYAIQEGYLDDEEGEWQNLLEEDVHNVIQHGKLSKGTTAHNISNERDDVFTCWLNKRECEEKYPALSYLIEQLANLPYELNRKSMELYKTSTNASSNEKNNHKHLNLCKLSDSHIMLMVITSEKYLVAAKTTVPLSTELIVEGMCLNIHFAFIELQQNHDMSICAYVYAHV